MLLKQTTRRTTACPIFNYMLMYCLLFKYTHSTKDKIQEIEFSFPVNIQLQYMFHILCKLYMACNQIKVLSAKLKANTPETTITLFVSIDNITVISLRKEALLYFRKHTTYSNKGYTIPGLIRFVTFQFEMQFIVTFRLPLLSLKMLV